jgi:hypothetical protein
MDRNVCREGLGWRSQRAGVHELTGPKALRIGSAAGGNPAADNRDDVGRRGADVEEKSIRMVRRDSM